MEGGIPKKETFLHKCVAHTVQKTKFVGSPVLPKAVSYSTT